MSPKNTPEMDVALDEIEAAQEMLEVKSIAKKKASVCRGWILKQKLVLKELGYKGKMPRKKRES